MDRLGSYSVLAPSHVVVDARETRWRIQIGRGSNGLNEGKIPADKVRVLQDSASIPEYMWTFRAGLDSFLKDEKSARPFWG